MPAVNVRTTVALGSESIFFAFSFSALEQEMKKGAQIISARKRCFNEMAGNICVNIRIAFTNMYFCNDERSKAVRTCAAFN